MPWNVQSPVYLKIKCPSLGAGGLQGGQNTATVMAPLLVWGERGKGWESSPQDAQSLMRLLNSRCRGGMTWNTMGLEHVCLFSTFFFNSQNCADLPVTLFLSASCMLMHQISSTSGTKDRGETMSPATSWDLRRMGRSRLRVPLPIGEATQDLPKHPDLGHWPSCLFPYWSSKQEWVTSSGIWEKKRGA